jgi:drug/metabolite transporter (DMT)-like permease
VLFCRRRQHDDVTTATTAAAPSAPVDLRQAPPPALPLLAAGVTVLLWASAFVVIRSAGTTYAPGPMALGRMLVAALALTLLVAVHRRRTRSAAPLVPRGRTLGLVVTYGVLWFGVYIVAVNAAEQHLDAGTTALLVNVAPLLVAVLAGLLLGEGLPRTLAAGLAVAFAGVVVIGTATSTGRADTAGVLFALAAAGLYAVAVLLQKRALRTVDPLTATWLGCLVGAAVCLPFAPALVRTLADAAPSATAGIVYLGVFPTAVAFTTWAYALTHTTAGRLSATTYLVPALTVLLSWVLLAETPSALALVGGALCLAGVAVTRLPARRAGRAGGPGTTGPATPGH